VLNIVVVHFGAYINQKNKKNKKNKKEESEEKMQKIKKILKENHKNISVRIVYQNEHPVFSTNKSPIGKGILNLRRKIQI